MYTALDVANTILQQAFREDISITPMKLQKLLYILYKTYLKETGCKMFTEVFGAWKRGPVVPIVYYEFKQYGASPIREYSLNNNGKAFVVNLKSNNEVEKIFLKTWKKYKGFDAVTLSEMTHCTGGAWEKAVNNRTLLLADIDIKNERDFLDVV